MPFFPKKSNPKEELKEIGYGNIPVKPYNSPQFVNPIEGVKEKQKLVFHCQQAQGSPTGVITGFSNVKELYQRISECYDFEPSEILFCTLNTHKINMGQLLGAEIALGDFIFVHRKGRPTDSTSTKDLGGNSQSPGFGGRLHQNKRFGRFGVEAAGHPFVCSSF